MNCKNLQTNNCRICLDENVELDWNNFLHGNSHLTYKDCYYKYTQLLSFDGDKLSTMLCHDCCNGLQDIETLISKAIETHYLLMDKLSLNVINNDKNNIKQETTNFEMILGEETDIKPDIQNVSMCEDYREKFINESEKNGASTISEKMDSPLTQLETQKKQRLSGEEIVENCSDQLQNNGSQLEMKANHCSKTWEIGKNCSNSYNQNACQHCQKFEKEFGRKFDQITDSLVQLKVTIENLAANNVRQNMAMMEALTKQTVLTEKVLGKDMNEANIRKIFPIQTADDLAEINSKIKEEDFAVYTRYMSSLLRGQLQKSLTDVFSLELILASNIEGIHGKVSLKNFKKLFDILMDAVRANGEENPEKAIRNALKLIKKRHFQTICVNRKKLTI